MNKVALITGGNGGIGKAISIKLAKQGYDIVINYYSDYEGALETKTICEKYKVNVMLYKCDVSNFDEVENMMRNIVEQMGRIDVLVNNSGVTKDTLILRMKESDFDRVININLKGCFNCIKHISKIMMKQKFGAIVNISSVVGLVGNAGQVNYSASKSGILGITKSVAKELVSLNVRCNAIAPGFIETDMTENLPKTVKEDILKSIPMKKMGNPEDVANVVNFLVSDESKYITGQVINVDGGMVM
ncbi:MAG: 3-oxoacyl-[acyl-carrier-protein] reductase [Peptoniphilaceae bacterium]|uniref:3-oxoacyl-[acyl-carrier-protein] reductase n=1 Tax=Parvimonas sp. TaxID=1944660 RepID=UPI0025F2092E|nr:3-oxoacyl-[acyl-carrier-protein] reductase [Parvimonas sp.]MCI5997181.1 3-oxoacyl-[acyl-carrier-protein] reductase [Parvimonas sp.]MDD7764274.1 3-oxoacyl-[acyl-carrier-protein] reductase [Peptoniphilaceae bacterium]MDY3051537.1 3-oxoacyl-[acyl-carrier-protein] reductase [Parvimonas sp.]